MTLWLLLIDPEILWLLWYLSALPWLILPLLTLAFIYARPRTARGPQLRSKRTRIICAAIAAFILLAVSVTTYSSARTFYEVDDTPPTLSAPTQAVPPLPEPVDNAGDTYFRDEDLKYLRYIVHIALAEGSGRSRRILDAKSFEVAASNDEWRQHSHSLSGRGAKARFDLMALDFHPYLFPKIYFEIRFLGPGDYETEKPKFNRPDATHQALWSHQFSNHPLSITACGASRMEFLYLVQRVAPDDPLRPVPAGQLLDEFDQSKISEPLYARRPHIPRGFALATHIGYSSLFLLAAALLAAQCFRQRNLAFAGTLLAVVLYVVALDSMVMSIHASHLRDPAAPAAHRAVAEQMLNASFFYAYDPTEVID